MKLASLFSGGKDSVYALYVAQQHHDVVCLVTLQSSNPDSFMFHTPNINITQLQAQALNLPIVTQQTKGVQDEELKDLRTALQQAKLQHHIEGVVTGAVASVYQATRIQTICDELGLVCFNPLWLIPQQQLLHELLHHNFHVYIAGIAAFPLDHHMLGKQLDQPLVDHLLALEKSHQINPAGEGGEIETIVLDGPNFTKKIVPENTDIVYENHAGTWTIQQAQVVDK